MVAMNKAPAKPTLILINQPRTKIGISYGDPTVLPGGPMVNKFLPALIIRLYGKNEMDTKYHKAMPVRKAVTLTVMKWKVPILAQSAQYEAVMIAHKGLRVGMSDWFNTFKGYGQALGLIEKCDKDENLGFGKGKGYKAFESAWPTFDAMKQDLYVDPDLCDAVKDALIEALVNDGSALNAQEGGED